MKTLATVIGMHRSGTSATAGALARMGLDFGPPALLMPANASNLRGYYEHLPVVMIHDRLLHALGASWKDPQLPGDWQLRIPTNVARRALVNWMEALQGDGPHAVKDPRMSLFAPLWRDAAHRAGVSLRPLIVIRRSDAVVSSLSRRDGLSASHVRDLLTIYGSGVADWATNPGAAVVHFEDLLGDPVGTLKRALRDLHIPYSDEPQVEASVQDFIDEGLSHA